MPEPIEDIKRRIIKSGIQREALENENLDLEMNIAEYEGHKIEHINPKSTRIRNLFKENVKNAQKPSE